MVKSAGFWLIISQPIAMIIGIFLVRNVPPIAYITMGAWGFISLCFAIFWEIGVRKGKWGFIKYQTSEDK